MRGDLDSRMLRLALICKMKSITQILHIATEPLSFLRLRFLGAMPSCGSYNNISVGV